jgi:hypothetical protein
MTITIDKKGYGFQDMKFVLSALEDDERLITPLKYAHVENGMVICTDGHRMHTFSPDPELLAIPDGNYTVKQGKDFIILDPVPDVNFPQWKNVFEPAGNGARFFAGTVQNNKRQNNHFMEKVLGIASFHFDGTATLNMDYLKPLIIDECEWYITCNEAGKSPGPIRFDNCTKSAVIMPVRI